MAQAPADGFTTLTVLCAALNVNRLGAGWTMLVARRRPRGDDPDRQHHTANLAAFARSPEFRKSLEKKGLRRVVS